MHTRDRLNQLLSSIGQLGLTLDDNNSCQMRCNNGLICVIELMPDRERAFAYIALSRLPTTDSSRAALMQEALSLNLQLQKEGVLSLVYDARIDHVTLCTQCKVMDITLDQFDQWLGNLITKGEYVRRKLVASGLQASLNQSQGNRRNAVRRRQEMALQQQSTQKMPNPTTQNMQPNQLHMALRNAQMFKI